MAFSGGGGGCKRRRLAFGVALFLTVFVEVSSSFQNPPTTFITMSPSVISTSTTLVPSQAVSSSSVITNTPAAISNRKKGSHKVHLIPPHRQQRSGSASKDVLIPSQVRMSTAKRQQQLAASSSSQDVSAVRLAESSTTTKPQSQATGNAPTNIGADNSNRNNPNNNPNNNNRSSRRRLRPRQRDPAATSVSSNNINNTSNQKSSKSTKAQCRHARFGSLPDTQWGSIPMDHLRQHPSFVPLPLPQDLPTLTHLEDVRNIRQDSWQWDALHDGRCTTSQAVAALGFLEPKAGRILEIPSTWQRRGIGAYQRLRQKALRTLEEMNSLVTADNNPISNDSAEEDDDDVVVSSSSAAAAMVNNDRAAAAARKLWKKETTLNSPQNNNTAFAARYLFKLSDEERQERRRRSKHCSGNGMAIRMIWGDAQEATSVLTALNYFTQQTPEAIVKEVGMCGAGLKLNQTDGSSPSRLLIGATPDAVIEYPDGRVEALEVKNHCPFVTARQTKRKNVPKKQFTLRELPFRMPYIFPLYIPQLMLEILCLGPECKSAVMVRQTATTGALILRIHRDDEWIEEMTYWLQRFQQDYVEAGVEPAPNFFFDSRQDGPRYQAFLEMTKGLATKVELVNCVPHRSIQRSTGPRDALFLD